MNTVFVEDEVTVLAKLCGEEKPEPVLVCDVAVLVGAVVLVVLVAIIVVVIEVVDA